MLKLPHQNWGKKRKCSFKLQRGPQDHTPFDLLTEKGAGTLLGMLRRRLHGTIAICSVVEPFHSANRLLKIIEFSTIYLISFICILRQCRNIITSTDVTITSFESAPLMIKGMANLPSRNQFLNLIPCISRNISAFGLNYNND